MKTVFVSTTLAASAFAGYGMNSEGLLG